MFQAQGRKVYIVQYDACIRVSIKHWWGARQINPRLAAISGVVPCRFDKVLRGRSDFANDGIHPSNAGNAKIAKYMMKELI